MKRITKTVGNGLAGSAMLATTAVAAHGYGPSGAVIAASVMAVAAIVVVIAREWWWHRALRRPGEDIRWLLEKTTPEVAERFAAHLQVSHEQVLRARNHSDSTEVGDHAHLVSKRCDAFPRVIQSQRSHRRRRRVIRSQPSNEEPGIGE
jgi:hypothetical protein